MSADKRIPVTEDTWRKLGELKGAGQTYDDVLEELIEEHRTREFFDRLDDIEETSEFVPLDELDADG